MRETTKKGVHFPLICQTGIEIEILMKWVSNSRRRMRKWKKPKKGKSMIKKGSLGAQKKSSTSGGDYGRCHNKVVLTSMTKGDIVEHECSLMSKVLN